MIYPFTFEDVRKAIKNGQDTTNQYVAVTIRGQAVLVSLNEMQADKSPYATRTPEAYNLGNDYIGPAAAADDYHVETVYEQLTSAGINSKRLGDIVWM